MPEAVRLQCDKKRIIVKNDVIRFFFSMVLQFFAAKIKYFKIVSEYGLRTHKNLTKKVRRALLSCGPSIDWRLPTLPLGIAVPSAQMGLTSLFGMDRGGSPSLLPPLYNPGKRLIK